MIIGLIFFGLVLLGVERKREQKLGTKITVYVGRGWCRKAGSDWGWKGDGTEGALCWCPGGADTGMEGLARLYPVAEHGKLQFSKSLGLVNASWLILLKNSSANVTHAMQRSTNMSC